MIGNSSHRGVRRDLVLVASTLALLGGCRKRAFNDASGVRAEADQDGEEDKNLADLKRQLREEWVWMPASEIPVYALRRCPLELGPVGAVAEYHLRKLKQAARWDPLWAVACVLKGQGKATIYLGKTNQNNGASLFVINKISVSKDSLGRRVPRAFVVQHRNGGCQMEYALQSEIPGLTPSLGGAISYRSDWFKVVRDIVSLPYTEIAIQECATIDGAADKVRQLFGYHSWRMVNLNVVERAFLRAAQAKDRWDLKAEPVLAPAGVPPGGSGTATAQPGASEMPPDGKVQDAEAAAVKAETEPDDLAAIWSNPVFRSWVVRDLRRKDSEANLVSLLSYPMIIEATRWAAWGAPKGGTGAGEPAVDSALPGQ